MTDYGTQYVTVDNPNLTMPQGGAGWLLGILALLAVIAAIVFLILWLFQRNKTNNPLAVTNPQFSITSSNQMKATWDAINNSSDVVNLYVIKSGGKLNFTTNGDPINSSIIVARSGQVAGTALSATSSPALTNGVSYVGYLVVTNPNINDYKPYLSQVLTVGNFGPTGSFHIQAVGQKGEIVYATPEIIGETGATGSVGYNFSGTTTLGNNLFFYDSNQNICTVPPSAVGIVNNLDLDINANTTCASFGDRFFPPFVLTAENSTLGIKQFDSSTDTTNKNAKWVFDSNDKSWCIANSSKTRCMQLSSVTNLNLIIPFKGSITRDDDFPTPGILTVETPNLQLSPGQVISGPGVENGTIIVSVKDLSANTYFVNIEQEVPSGTNMTAQLFNPISIANQTASNTGWINIRFTN